MTDAKPTNVVAALSRVMADIGGIGKDNRSPQGYAYRGIEQITKEVQPLFAKYGIVFAPQVETFEQVDLIVNGKPWTDQKLTVRYKVYGPGGIEDFIEARVPGIGRDNSDKGANKAMSQAFKYALIQVLCIADAKDDSDSEPPHEASHRSATDQRADTGAGDRTPPAPATSFDPPTTKASAADVKKLEGLLKSATAAHGQTEQAATDTLLAKYGVANLWELTKAEANEATATLETWEKKAQPKQEQIA